jgi:hypothetical protein
MKASLVIACAVVAVPAFAESPLHLSGRPQDEAALESFLLESPALKARLDGAIRQEASQPPIAEETDLRDAVADVPPPSAKSPAPSACRTLADCAAPELEIDADGARDLPGAIGRLVRPWMLLQKARGASLWIAAAEGPGDAALVLTPKGLRSSAPLTVHVTARPVGGFKVWLEDPLMLAWVYGDARGAVLGDAR